MKKLFIISVFLCIMFFPKNTFALDFNVNGTTYQVNDEESFRDYIYYTYINGTNYDRFFIFRASNYQYYSILIPKNSNDYIIKNYSYSQFRTSSDLGSSYTDFYALNFNFPNSSSSSQNWNNYTLALDNSNYNSWLPNSGSRSAIYYFTYYRSKNSSLTNFEEIPGNFTYQDITSKYQAQEPEEESDVGMFDVVETFIIQFINILPFIIPFILIMNLICRMLFNERS